MLSLFPHPLFAAPRACVGRRCDPLFSARPLPGFGFLDAFRDLDEEMERLERAFFADDEEMPEAATEPAVEEGEEPRAAADDEGRVEKVTADGDKEATETEKKRKAPEGAVVPRRRSAHMWPTLRTVARPHVDVSVADDKVVVKADVPGVDKEHLKVSVSDGVLTVSGERKEERGERGAGHYERVFGRFQRSVRLPEGVKLDGITAKHNNGVLVVEVPREAPKKPEPLAINVE
jgi:HSP20 family protein